jgi:hypothetical protein
MSKSMPSLSPVCLNAVHRDKFTFNFTDNKSRLIAWFNLSDATDKPTAEIFRVNPEGSNLFSDGYTDLQACICSSVSI